MDRKTKVYITIGAVIVICALLYWLRQVLSPVFFSLMLAYFLDPAIDKLEARKINRTLAIFIFLMGMFVAFGLLIVVIIPLMQLEISNLMANLPKHTEGLQDKIMPLVEKVTNRKLPDSLGATLDEVMATIKTAPPEIIKPLSVIARQAFSSTLSVIFWMMNILLVPVFTFYFLRDFDRMKERALDLVPSAYKKYISERFSKVDEILASFIRGQLTLCTILAVLYTAGLMIVDIEMAVVIGVLSGYLFIIPYVGTIVGVVLGVAMALLQYHDVIHVVAVIAVFGIVQLLEGYLLTPKIVGEKVGLDPVMVILAILIGGSIFGILGVLLAVPVTAVGKVFVKDLYEWYKESAYYLEEG